MNTYWLLIAQYQGRAIIPLDQVCRDYLWHLTPEKLLRKASRGEINLPIVRMDRTSQKAAKGVHIEHLATYIDDRTKTAEKELDALSRACRLSSTRHGYEPDPA